MRVISTPSQDTQERELFELQQSINKLIDTDLSKKNGK